MEEFVCEASKGYLVVVVVVAVQEQRMSASHDLVLLCATFPNESNHNTIIINNNTSSDNINSVISSDMDNMNNRTVTMIVSGRRLGTRSDQRQREMIQNVSSIHHREACRQQETKEKDTIVITIQSHMRKSTEWSE